MAEGKETSKPKAETSEVININLEPFIMPLAVILASIIIAIGMVISANILKGSVLGTSTTNAAADTAGNNGATQPTGDVAAKTSIDDDPILGNKDTAKVAIVEFSDYECPFCKRHFQQTSPDIIKNYVDTGKAILIFRDYPLSFHDPMATYEANAANCVRDQGGDKKYWEMHDLMYTNTTSNGTGLTKDQVSKFASQIGMDMNKFNSCAESEKYKAEIQKDEQDGTTAGINGTPGFVIGKLNGKDVDGVLISGALPYDSFKTAIEAQLAK